MQEKEFIQKGARKVRLHEFLEDELEGAGYSHAEIERTPTSTKIVVHAQKPGLVIGRGGSRIRELTSDMEEAFNFENPQIEVNEIEDADANAEVVAKSIADWLEKGGHAKRVGYTYLRRMKEAGAIGAEIEITGKLSGNRGRTEKFSFGYVKRCGNTSKDNVQKGYELARTKPGAIGVKVRIMKEMPDFLHRDVDVSEEVLHMSVEETQREKADRIQEIIVEAEDMTSASLEEAIETKEEQIKTDDISKDEVRDAFESVEDMEELEKEVEERVEEVKEEVEAVKEETGEEMAEDAEAVEEEVEDLEEEAEEIAEEAEDEVEEAAEEVEEELEEIGEEIEEIVSGTISDAKEAINDMSEPDFDALLHAEEDNKDRKTFKDWIETQKD
ncbi:30S ribosomal protein S3 [Candidatus Nanohalobium constans]|uniref:Small ribosomal subunit protein uS3 n=1 Tax=Candidatus Nanohalobium constans TaxID=2565781 RepID=A0A5Q0UH42_9ARCH|nr:30S ribosomal protein S3 [Candidatus Nanohalobium constans]QGA80983.1 30S ribosomal protein S3 [Candidatus Nanohalobium constans]